MASAVIDCSLRSPASGGVSLLSPSRLFSTWIYRRLFAIAVGMRVTMSIPLRSTPIGTTPVAAAPAVKEHKGFKAGVAEVVRTVGPPFFIGIAVMVVIVSTTGLLLTHVFDQHVIRDHITFEPGREDLS